MKILISILSLTFALSATAANPFNYKKLLGPYPAHGSVAEARDLEILLKFQENRTEEECRLAGLESKASLENFFGKHHGLLSSKELKRLKVTLLIPLVRSGINIGGPIS